MIWQKDRRLPKIRPALIQKPSTYKIRVSQMKGSKLPCVFCNGNHYNSECQVCKILDQRKKGAYELGLCIRRLRTGHQSKNCQMGQNCYYCRKNHNSAFCDRFGNQPTDKLLNEKKGKRERTQVSTLEVKSVIDRKPGEALLAVVKVVVNNPLSEKIKKGNLLIL